MIPMTFSTLGQPERVVDTIRAAAADTEENRAQVAADKAVTRSALELLGSKRNDAYEAALTKTPKSGGRTRLPAIRTRWVREEAATADVEGLRRFLEDDLRQVTAPISLTVALTGSSEPPSP